MVRLLSAERQAPLARQTFFGRGVYGREGRRIGAIRSQRAGRPGGNQPYAIVELSGYGRNATDLRAIPLAFLSYLPERGHFNCDLSELCIRRAPIYAGSGDWLDVRWTTRLDDYFDTFTGGAGKPCA